MRTAGTDSQTVLKDAWEAALAAADPVNALAGQLPAAPRGRLVLIAAGKAAPHMATAAVAHYRSKVSGISGVVAAPVPAPLSGSPLAWFEAGHPTPTEASVQAGEAVLRELSGLSSDDLVLVLLSGGASSLLTVPDGISLAEMQQLAAGLLASGAAVTEMNTVRRKLCRLKGGGLALAASPAHVVCLVISDVVGDELAAIGSGPTVADPDSPADAIKVLDDYGLAQPAVRERLEQMSGVWRPREPLAATRIIAGGSASLRAAATVLGSAGFQPHILSDSITGDSNQAAGFHAAIARQVLASNEPFQVPCALLSGGETTVRVNGSRTGNGGRNSAFALAFACELWGQQGLHALVADTDGKDGHSDAAGAFISGRLFETASLPDARQALADHDSGGFFSRHDHSLVTGPTGTNVNDLRIILLERP